MASCNTSIMKGILIVCFQWYCIVLDLRYLIGMPKVRLQNMLTRSPSQIYRIRSFFSLLSWAPNMEHLSLNRSRLLMVVSSSTLPKRRLLKELLLTASRSGKAIVEGRKGTSDSNRNAIVLEISVDNSKWAQGQCRCSFPDLILSSQ